MRVRWRERREIELDRQQRMVEGERGAMRAILWRSEKAASISTVKSWIFLLIIPPLLRFNYSLPDLSVRLQVQPHTERPFASNQTAWPFNPSSLLQSWHDISGLSGAGRPCCLCCSPPQGGKALHYINHSDIVITAVLPWFRMQIPGYISLIYSAVSLSPHFSLALLLSLTFAYSHGNCVLLEDCFVGKSSGPILGF